MPIGGGEHTFVGREMNPTVQPVAVLYQDMALVSRTWPW